MNEGGGGKEEDISPLSIHCGETGGEDEREKTRRVKYTQRTQRQKTCDERKQRSRHRSTLSCFLPEGQRSTVPR